MYRMLGSEHEADLEREARKWRRAAELHRTARSVDHPRPRLPWTSHFAAAARSGVSFLRRLSTNAVQPNQPEGRTQR
jgi:hypothetical protein